MKKIGILVLSIFMLNQIYAQGISFEHGTLGEAMAKAKAENKLVFMDCYTTWCGPCKMMSKDVFPQEVVGTYMNANFVSIKMDMEKGEGIDLVKKYDIKGFPTLLFLDTNGKVLHCAVGGLLADPFIEQAKIAYDPTKQLSYLEKQYKDGNRDLALVSHYIKALFSALKRDEAAKVGKEFIPTMTTSQYMTEEGFTILVYTGVDYKSTQYEFLKKNKADFEKKSFVNINDLQYVFMISISNYLNGIAQTKTLPELNKAIAETHKDFVFAQQDQLDNSYRNKYYLSHKEYDNWFESNKKEADASMKKDQKDGLSRYINMAYYVAMDPSFASAGLYEKSIDMIESIKNINPDLAGMNLSLAVLYLKTSNKAKANENLQLYADKIKIQGTDLHPKYEEIKTSIDNL